MITASAALAAGGVLYASDSQLRRSTKLKLDAALRIGNLLTTVGIMTADYGYHVFVKKRQSNDRIGDKKEILAQLQQQQEDFTIQLINADKMGLERGKWINLLQDNRIQMLSVTEDIAQMTNTIDDRFSIVHRRNAERLRDMCSANGGLYIKLGQHLCMLDYIVPTVYQDVLTSLLSETPNSRWDAVRGTIKTDLGVNPEEIFDDIDPSPIASASLAQVHIAYKDGKKYAVKVQHAGLRESSHYDRWMITKIVDFIPKIFKDFDYCWLTTQMNENVPKELDFTMEHRNIDKCRVVLQDMINRGDVAVPTVRGDLSGARVLTMSFEEGAYITNEQFLEQNNISKTEIARTVAKVFCEQIFRHGFVHCGESNSMPDLAFMECPCLRSLPIQATVTCI